MASVCRQLIQRTMAELGADAVHVTRATLLPMIHLRSTRVLIWTDVPDLMEIPAAALDQELISVTSVTSP